MTERLRYLQSLPRKRGASGAALFHGGRLLLVKPTYKDGWHLPGGVIDALESPLTACIRECQEELGLTVTIDRLLVVDWLEEPMAGAFDSLQFVFGGPELDASALQHIVLPPDELSAWRLATLDEAFSMLSEAMTRRLQCALAADGGAVYTESGFRRC